MQNMDGIKVTWSLSKAGSSIEVHYAVENLSTHSFYLLDEPLLPEVGRYVVAPDRSVVQRGNSPHLIKFSRGFVRADSQEPELEQGENNPVAPAARSLPAGGRIEGAFHVALPLTPWHPSLKMVPFRDPQRAILEVGYVGGDPEWRELPSATAVVRVPTPAWAAKQKWASGGEKPLP